MRKGIRLEMWHRTTINEAGLVAHYFFELVGVAWLPKGLVTCFPTGLLPMESHEPGTSNLYFSYSYPISTLPSKGALNVFRGTDTMASASLSVSEIHHMA
jgi:hypothetical protein